jgi:hypothetical protein
MVMINELHLFIDESRGYILGLMLTKLPSLEQAVQIIGKSRLESVPGQCLSRSWVTYDYHSTHQFLQKSTNFFAINQH